MSSNSNFTFPNPQRSQGQPDFTPKTRVISALTQGLVSQITTSTDHGYQDGWTISVYIPEEYGFTIEGKRGVIQVVSSTEFTIDLDTSIYPTFTVPTSPPPFTLAHCVPVSGTTDNVA